MTTLATYPPAVAELLGMAATRYGVTVPEVLGRSRSQSVRLARRAVVHSLRYRLDWSLHQIGRLLGRDHSTIVFLAREDG